MRSPGFRLGHGCPVADHAADDLRVEVAREVGRDRPGMTFTTRIVSSLELAAAASTRCSSRVLGRASRTPESGRSAAIEERSRCGLPPCTHASRAPPPGSRRAGQDVGLEHGRPLLRSPSTIGCVEGHAGVVDHHVESRGVAHRAIDQRPHLRRVADVVGADRRRRPPRSPSSRRPPSRRACGRREKDDAPSPPSFVAIGAPDAARRPVTIAVLPLQSVSCAHGRLLLSVINLTFWICFVSLWCRR